MRSEQPCTNHYKEQLNFDFQNFAIVTGVLVANHRDADNRDAYRPVLDLEITRIRQDGSYEFGTIPVVVSDTNLIKTVSGAQPGELLIVCGYLRIDENAGLYIEPSEVTRMAPCKGNKHNSRANLLSASPRFNIACVSGRPLSSRKLSSSDEETASCTKLELQVGRKRLEKGNLKNRDTIPVLTELQVPCLDSCEEVCCIGELGILKQEAVMHCYSISTAKE